MFTKFALLAGASLVFGLGAMSVSSIQDVGGKKKVEGQSNAGLVAGIDGNHWACEPILVYDVSGSTFVGEVHKSLTVYSNGRVSFAEFAPGSSSRNASKVLAVKKVEGLRKQLVQDGARQLQDQEKGVPDAPMHTLTIFKGATDATCHTFSYWVRAGGYTDVQQTLDTFIEANFAE